MFSAPSGHSAPNSIGMVEHKQKFQMRRHSIQSVDNRTNGTLGSVIQIRITMRTGGQKSNSFYV